MEKHSVVYIECISAPASALWKAVADMGDDGQLLTTTSDLSKIVDVARKQTVAFDGVLARTSTKLPLAILLMPQHVVVGAGPSSAHNITSIFDTLSKAIGAQQHMVADFDLDAAAAAADRRHQKKPAKSIIAPLRNTSVSRVFGINFSHISFGEQSILRSRRL